MADRFTAVLLHTLFVRDTPGVTELALGSGSQQVSDCESAPWESHPCRVLRQLRPLDYGSIIILRACFRPRRVQPGLRRVSWIARFLYK